jgi:hypothetical protein
LELISVYSSSSSLSLSLSLSILLDLEHNMNIYETIKEMMGKEEITLEAGGWRGTILTD